MSLGRWTLVIDQPLTRRKRWHLLYRPDGEYETGAQYLSDVLDYMANHDIGCYMLQSRSSEFEIEMQRAVERERT